MSRSIFASWPPDPPDVEEGPCDCCGNTLDDCICPECHHCHEAGRPACYDPAGCALSFTPEQLAGQARLAEWMRKRQESDAAEADYWASICPKCNGATTLNPLADNPTDCPACNGTGHKSPKGTDPG